MRIKPLVPMKPMRWILTLQYEADDKGRQMVKWESGIITPSVVETRGDLLTRIWNQVNQPPAGDNPVPLFFYLEPEEL